MTKLRVIQGGSPAAHRDHLSKASKLPCLADADIARRIEIAAAVDRDALIILRNKLQLALEQLVNLCADRGDFS